MFMTIERVLENESMDSFEEALDYDGMDHSHVNRVFVDDLLGCGSLGDEVLDAGTGTARIPIRLCRLQDEIGVVAVDSSVAMLDIGRNNVEVESLTERIMLDHVDAKQLPYEDDRFDTVISNSLIHHIPDPIAVMKEMLRVVRPGGLVFVRDLLRPADEPRLQHLVDTYAATAGEHARQMFDDSLRAALDLVEIRDCLQRLGCDPAQAQQTSDRHWTWSMRPSERL